MFGFFKSPGNHLPKQNSVDSTNPFDLVTESDAAETKSNPRRKASSEPILKTPDFKTNPFDDGSSNNHPNHSSVTSKYKYKNGFGGTGGLQSQTTEELEDYAVSKSRETTKTVDSCLRLAEEMRSGATRTLEMLHHQGEQINGTHMTAVELDNDLSRGEKLLNSLGGMLSRTWKPKKTREIQGPVITPDKPSNQCENQHEQRDKLGLALPGSRGKPSQRTPPTEPTNALQKLEMEREKQDDALSDLSNILGDLKSMAVDMGSELNRQNKALEHLSDDVDELNSRVKGANQRTRHLLRK